MGEVRCENCKFWRAYSGDDYRGECRRHSPIISDKGISRWPLVTTSDWCGDFEKKDLTEGNGPV